MKAKFWNYGIYSSDNYGAHTLAFEDAKGNRFYYSYKTLVAFAPVGEKMYVLQNYWNTTTGKHLNWIDGGDKKNRLTYEEFDKAYKQFFE